MQTFTAFVRHGNNGAPDIEWRGLTRGQAEWRYHYIRRNWFAEFNGYREYGYSLDSLA